MTRLGTVTRPGSREDGMLSLWVAPVAAAALAVLMLLVDGGAKIRAGDHADAAAAEAARAAVIAVGPRPADVPARLAAAGAQAYLARAGLSGSVTILDPREVQVRVSASDRGPISGRTFTVTRTAVARLLVGVESGG